MGGYSSFAKQYFDDENFIAQYPFFISILYRTFINNHDIPGVVTMLNSGVHKNNSLFAISLKPLPHLGMI